MRRGERRRPVTDRGDASGTGYFSPAGGSWLPSLARAALGREVELPRLAAPAETVGQTWWGAALSAGTGDNMGAALGLGLGRRRRGHLDRHVGHRVRRAAPAGSADPSGAVAGFADATGRFLPLVCTLNAARVLTVTARLLDVDADTLSALALAARPGADGLTLLPYLDGERTPNRPDATGVLSGLTTANATRESLARAAVEGVLCGLADAMDHLIAAGVRPRRVLLIGGGARSEAVRVLAPGILGTAVVVPEAAEYVAIGAARQAAWALARGPGPPPWPAPESSDYQAEPVPQVREKYAALRDATAP